jgi:hypothetical protein
MLIAAGSPAEAGCYEDIGCSDRDIMHVDELKETSCSNLWHVRNEIYHENGYCFASDRGRRFFSNSGCTEQEQANLQLSAVERHNVEAIATAEIAKDCDLE